MPYRFKKKYGFQKNTSSTQGPPIQAPEKYEYKKIKGLAQGQTRQVPATYGSKKNASSAQGPATQAQKKNMRSRIIRVESKIRTNDL